MFKCRLFASSADYIDDEPMLSISDEVFKWKVKLKDLCLTLGVYFWADAKVIHLNLLVKNGVLDRTENTMRSPL